jgi:hypothetical protein
MLVTVGAMAAWRAVAGLRPRFLHHQWPRLVGSASQRLGGSFSGRHLQSGGSGRQLPLFALPPYPLARKNEEDLAAAGEGGEGEAEASKSGGRFPFKVRRSTECPHALLHTRPRLLPARLPACWPPVIPIMHPPQVVMLRCAAGRV